MKKIIALICAALLLTACGGSKITSDEAQLQMANTDIAASAKILDGFKAKDTAEAAELWRTAKKDGNGALMYALYSEANKESFKETCEERGSWKLYDGPNPQSVDILEISDIGEGKSVAEMVTVRGGASKYSQIVITKEHGGYYIETESAEYDAPMGA